MPQQKVQGVYPSVCADLLKLWSPWVTSTTQLWIKSMSEDSQSIHTVIIGKVIFGPNSKRESWSEEWWLWSLWKDPVESGALIHRDVLVGQQLQTCPSLTGQTTTHGNISAELKSWHKSMNAMRPLTQIICWPYVAPDTNHMLTLCGPWYKSYVDAMRPLTQIICWCYAAPDTCWRYVAPTNAICWHFAALHSHPTNYYNKVSITSKARMKSSPK